MRITILASLPLLLAFAIPGPDAGETSSGAGQDPPSVEARKAESKRDRRFDDRDFRSLFDGHSMEGWVTEGGRYDGKAAWTLEDGAITGREGENGAGGLIYTDREYEQYIFTVDVKITWPFDSGIFLHMSPHGKGSQITIDYRPNGEVGGIYSDGFMAHNPDAAKSLRDGEWNHFEVMVRGRNMHVTAWMNGDKISDYVYPPELEGYVPRGRVGLQVHGAVNAEPDARVQFKNMRIRELPPHDPALFDVDDRGFLTPTQEGRDEGWTPLFNGTDLSGWEAADGSEGYVADQGVLRFPVEGKPGYLRTTEDFQDFELRLDFKTSFMANSGLFLRGNRAGGNPAYSGCEVQILDDFNWETVTASKLKSTQFTGSLYGAVAAGKRHALKPLGDWNTYELSYLGSILTVKLNGYLLYSVDTHALDVEPPFAGRAPAGFIGLQRHAPGQVTGESYAWFRNMYIRRH